MSHLTRHSTTTTTVTLLAIACVLAGATLARAGKVNVTHVPDMQTCRREYRERGSPCSGRCILANSFMYKGYQCYDFCYTDDKTGKVQFKCDQNVKEMQIIDCGIHTDSVCLSSAYSFLPTQCCTDSAQGLHCCQDSMCLLDGCTTEEQTIFAMVAFIGFGILYCIIYQTINLFHRITKHKLSGEQLEFIVTASGDAYDVAAQKRRPQRYVSSLYHWLFDLCNIGLCYALFSVLFAQQEINYSVFVAFFTMLTRFFKNGLLLQYHYRVAEYCALKAADRIPRKQNFLAETSEASCAEGMIARFVFWFYALPRTAKITVFVLLIFPVQCLLPFDALIFSTVERLYTRSKVSLKKLEREVYFYASYNAQIQLLFQDFPVQAINIFWIFRIGNSWPIPLACLSIGCLSMIFRTYEYAYHLRKQYYDTQALNFSLATRLTENGVVLFAIACDCISKLFGWAFFATLSLRWMAWVYMIYATILYASLANNRLIKDILNQVQNDDSMLKRVCNTFLKCMLLVVLSIEISIPYSTFWKLEKVPFTNQYDHVYTNNQYFDQLVLFHYNQWSMDLYRFFEQVWFIFVIASNYKNAQALGGQYFAIFIFCSLFSLMQHAASFYQQRKLPQQVEERSDRPNFGGLLRYISRSAMHKTSAPNPKGAPQAKALKYGDARNALNNENPRKEINLVQLKGGGGAPQAVVSAEALRVASNSEHYPQEV